MPLGDDQKAMLRLLAGGQSYDDIAALMGLSVEEVVTRARGAVAQLESEGIPAPALPDAPGGAAPPPPAPPAEQTPPPAPAAAPKPEPAAPAPKPTPRPAKPPRDRGMLIAVGGGLVGLIAIVVLAVLLISNGDGDGDAGSGAGDSTAVAESGGSANREPTTAQLEAVDGSAASGSAEFGRVKDSLALGIDATGIERLPKGQIYMVWLADTPEKLLPLTAVVANKANRIKASYQVPTEAVVYLASGEFDRLVITRTRTGELRKSLERANTDKDFPAYTGDPVLEGQIVGPIVGAAERLEQAQKERKEAE